MAFKNSRLLFSQTRRSSLKPNKIDFSDPKVSFKSKSFGQLLRGQLVFTSCQIKPVVKHAEPLMKLSYKVLGGTITDKLLKLSFFGHFCAGEDEITIKPTVKYLESCGIGSILDFAAESDVEGESVVPASSVASASSTKNEVKVQCRIYDYKNEALCDSHTETFEKCIRAVKSVSPTGFAAIKCTALGNPELLKRASVTLTELRKLFHKLDPDNTGFVTKEQFLKTFDTKVDGKDVSKIFESCDADGDGKVDYIEWSNGLALEELHLVTGHCTVQGPLADAVLDENERELYRRMRARIDSLATLAQSLGVRLMIDAEHTYFQPAIDNITVDLAKRFNKSGSFPVIFSTYQMYLRDSAQRLRTDMERARKGNYKFAAKLVRGAYMVLEREHAAKNGLPDPINADLQTTHSNYNDSVREVISRIAAGHDVEVMAATHNQHSVELALQAMEEHGLPPSAGVYFGQLMGMSDHLTFGLGAQGYKAYKYVPYGKVPEVMPYLIRRAQENSDPFGGARLELKMTSREILNRLNPFR